MAANGSRFYQATAIFSVLFALAGFSYNVWRMEVSEANAAKREAAFEIMLQLAELEHEVYAAHYDQDTVVGNPRRGWVRVGLVRDLSLLASEPVTLRAQDLHRVWELSWNQLTSDRPAADAVVTAIEEVRLEVRELIKSLE